MTRFAPLSMGAAAAWAAAGGGRPPITPVAHVAGAGGANGCTTAGIDTTGANLLVAATGMYSSLTTLADSKSNTWNALTLRSNGDGTENVKLWWSTPTSVGAGHTFTCAGSNSFSNVSVAAFRNANASPFDQQGGATAGTFGGAGVLTAQPGSLTPAVDNSLVIAAWCQVPADGSNGGAATAVNGGYTLGDVGGYTASVTLGVGLAWLIQGARAAANPTITFPVAVGVALAAATFKPA